MRVCVVLFVWGGVRFRWCFCCCRCFIIATKKQNKQATETTRGQHESSKVDKQRKLEIDCYMSVLMCCVCAWLLFVCLPVCCCVGNVVVCFVRSLFCCCVLCWWLCLVCVVWCWCCCRCVCLIVFVVVVFSHNPKNKTTYYDVVFVLLVFFLGGGWFVLLLLSLSLNVNNTIYTQNKRLNLFVWGGWVVSWLLFVVAFK